MKFLKDKKGVSPVVGVMLMLAITVLLAAAVNMYTNTVTLKKPVFVANFNVKASIHDANITMDMMAGPAIQKNETYIKLASGTPQEVGYVNMSNVTFYHANYSSSQFIVPGDVAKISFTKKWDNKTNRWAAIFTGPQINMTIYQGQPLTLTLVDKQTGNVIWSGRIVMNYW